MNDFIKNKNLDNYIITLLGYTKINHKKKIYTNWYPWNRFKDVFLTLGYQCEWIEFKDLIRKDEKRLFITCDNPTSLELYQSSKIKSDDIIFQKLISFRHCINSINWNTNPKMWFKECFMPIYRTVEYLYDKGLNIYAFACQTNINLYPEKKRIFHKLKDRIFFINGGGCSFNWKQIKDCKPIINNLTEDITLIGSKWGKIGRGNIDSWEKYIQPLKDNNKYKFNNLSNINNQLCDREIINLLQKSKLCPIIHSSSWEVERGIQDQFYTVFLSGRFGICDNLGAIDIFGKEIKEICTENKEDYYKKSIYFLHHPIQQYPYIKFIQDKIKKQFNLYRQWEMILNNLKLDLNNSNYDFITNINYGFIPPNIRKEFMNKYQGEGINNYFDRIFIVNLKKDVDKRNKIIKYLHLLNIHNYEFIEAIDGDNENIIKHFNKISNEGLQTLWEIKHNKKRLVNARELGCLLSHLKILEIAKKRNYSKWLHLEDDVIFHKSIHSLFKRAMENVPDNWDIIYFGTTQAYWRENYNLEMINKLIYKANFSFGTFAFAVSKNNIEFMIERLKLFNIPVDSILISEVQNILNCYVLKYNIIVARLNMSSLRKPINNIQEEIKLFKKYNWNYHNFNI